ncbi:MAG: hypothetical protein ACRESC_01250 [Gammaproteobacteria bacterium]
MSSRPGVATGLSVFVLIGLLSAWTPVHADRLEPAAKACNLYFTSDSVFVGKVVSSTPYQEASGDIGGWIYNLTMVKSYRGVNPAANWMAAATKGATSPAGANPQAANVTTKSATSPAGSTPQPADVTTAPTSATTAPANATTSSPYGLIQPTVSVYTQNDSGQLQLEVGKTYLLFAAAHLHHLLSISDDGLSGEVTDKSSVMKDLDQIVTASSGTGGGDVYGRIVSYRYGEQVPLSGIAVDIVGDMQDYRVVSDKSGWFHVHVPAGQYFAKPMDDGWNFHTYDMAWDDADGFSIPNGGCAEIQLRADQRR